MANPIFVNANGQPMCFHMRPGQFKDDIRNLIVKHGGEMKSSALKSNENSIHLSKPGPSVSSDNVSLQFIHDCVSSNKLLNIEKYRFKNIVKETAEIDDIRVSKTRNHITIKKTNNGRQAYTYQDDMGIIKYIIRTNSSCLVRGRSMWTTLANNLPTQLAGRTWMSLRDRYLKIILPNIQNYDINKYNKEKLLCALKSVEQRKRKETIASLEKTIDNLINSSNSSNSESSDENVDETSNKIPVKEAKQILKIKLNPIDKIAGRKKSEEKEKVVNRIPRNQILRKQAAGGLLTDSPAVFSQDRNIIIKKQKDVLLQKIKNVAKSIEPEITIEEENNDDTVIKLPNLKIASNTKRKMSNMIIDSDSDTSFEDFANIPLSSRKKKKIPNSNAPKINGTKDSTKTIMNINNHSNKVISIEMSEPSQDSETQDLRLMKTPPLNERPVTRNSARLSKTNVSPNSNDLEKNNDFEISVNNNKGENTPPVKEKPITRNSAQKTKISPKPPDMETNDVINTNNENGYSEKQNNESKSKTKNKGSPPKPANTVRNDVINMDIESRSPEKQISEPISNNSNRRMTRSQTHNSKSKTTVDEEKSTTTMTSVDSAGMNNISSTIISPKNKNQEVSTQSLNLSDVSKNEKEAVSSSSQEDSTENKNGFLLPLSSVSPTLMRLEFDKEAFLKNYNIDLLEKFGEFKKLSVDEILEIAIRCNGSISEIAKEVYSGKAKKQEKKMKWDTIMEHLKTLTFTT